MIKAVLFDVDDTLIDYGKAERDGITAYLRSLAVACDPAAAVARFGELQGYYFDRYLAGLIDYVGQATALAAAMIDWLELSPLDDPYDWFLGYRRHYEASLTLFPDVLDGLAALGDIPLGIVTNSDSVYTRVKLRRTGLLARFDCIVGVDTAGVSKPHPRIFQSACAEMGHLPAVVAYVGDKKLSDAQAADCAGLHGVWLNRSNDGAGGLTDLRQLATALGLCPDRSPSHRATVAAGVQSGVIGAEVAACDG
ncbi:HAD family hydrolase [Lentzea sp. NPDC042327]|uniref:HAD family hydrolase n=1 Tax=Lentzea sp. NPDC042327 TaxID=3154801 RepID=UPI0033CF2AA0